MFHHHRIGGEIVQRKYSPWIPNQGQFYHNVHSKLRIPTIGGDRYLLINLFTRVSLTPGTLVYLAFVRNVTVSICITP